MQKNPLIQMSSQVREYLEQKVENLEQMGVCRNRLIVDPGFGFGKTFEQYSPV